MFQAGSSNDDDTEGSYDEWGDPTMEPDPADSADADADADGNVTGSRRRSGGGSFRRQQWVEDADDAHRLGHSSPSTGVHSSTDASREHSPYLHHHHHNNGPSHGRPRRGSSHLREVVSVDNNDDEDNALGEERVRHELPADDDYDSYDVDDPRFMHNNSGLADRGYGGALSDAISEDGLLSFVPEEEIVYTQEPSVKVIGRYLFGDRLGDGAYGKVKEALDIITLQRYAVKIMKNRRIRKIMYGQENVRREIQILRKLNHPNVTRLHDVLYNHAKEKIYMVLEYCHSNLQDMLKAAPQERLPLWQAQHYLVQLLDATAYIHSQGVIHRDIKPSNILIKSGHRLKLSDFGVADLLDMFTDGYECTRSSGTHVFQSPELAAGATTFDGVKVDVWAIGVTLWNMVTGSYPFFDDNVIDLFTSIAKCEYTMPDHLPPSLRNFIARTLTRDPKHRATVWDLQEHPWCRCELQRDADPVELVAKASTVFPYLEAMYEDTPLSDQGDVDEAGFVSPDMIAVSRRSSFGHTSPLIRSRSRSRASNVSPPSSSPQSDRGDRASRGGQGTLRRLWNSLFGSERSTSRERSAGRGNSAGSNISSGAVSIASGGGGGNGGRWKPNSMGQLAVSAISEEQEGEDEDQHQHQHQQRQPARSASTEDLNESRRGSVRSGHDDATERGRSHSSTITRNPDAFL